MPQTRLLYSASIPVSGAASRAVEKTGFEKKGFSMVPYFVDAVLANGGMMIGFLGAILHVSCWLLAVLFDALLAPKIDRDHSPATYAFWLFGLIALGVALAFVVGTAIWHACAYPENKVFIGGAPPVLMTVIVGGAQISMILTFINLIQLGSSTAGGFVPMLNSTDVLTGADEIKTAMNEFRDLVIGSLIFKLFVIAFLRQNQIYAGPAKLDEKFGNKVQPGA